MIYFVWIFFFIFGKKNILLGFYRVVKTVVSFEVVVTKTLRIHIIINVTDETEEWHDDPPDPDDNINRESTKKEETSKQSDFMHVFSIGHESLMFELWIDTSNGNVRFSLWTYSSVSQM